ncbi:MAG: DNA-processing protein DprA [Streptosporangiaceae bacterium]
MNATDEERLARVCLSRLGEPGDAPLGRLVARVGAVGAVASVRTGRVPPDLGITEEKVGGWQIRLPKTDPEALLFVCEQFGGRFVCPGNAEWPTTLDDLGARAPHGIWIRGAADLRHACLRSVALVGARAATPYGLRVAADLGAELADRAWTVVSGGALGIDAAGHRGALAADGLTVAVLANGIDSYYPPRNAELLAEIARRGLLVSELPPGERPTQLRFISRNRLIAALTRGTVVVEADLRSGANITANDARKLNRKVMAVPGPVTSVMSRGCHRLLRADSPATLVTSAPEIIEEAGLMGEGLEPQPRGPVLARDSLDLESRQVLDAVPLRGGSVPAQVAVTAGVDINTARSRIALLSALGFIQKSAAGWTLKR